VTFSIWSKWPDDRVVKEARRQARMLAEVAAMPADVRARKAPGRSTTPDEAACINRWLLVQYVDELQRRGVDTDAIEV